MKILHNKVALITGGNSGIGKATARLFAEQGARVIVTARRQDMLDAAVEHIGHGAIGIHGDVADLAHHTAVAEQIRGRFGGLDIYMANAGVIIPAPSEAVQAADFDMQFGINTRGVFFGVQAVAPIMRPGGSIVLTSSLAAFKPLEAHAVYAGSKAAVAAFARNWVLEFRSRGIRVNLLSPGPVDTDIITKMGIQASERAGFLAATARLIPAGRLGTVEELAQAALFLASDASAFVNGVELRADGGMALA